MDNRLGQYKSKKKKESEAKIQPSSPHAWSIKDLLDLRDPRGKSRAGKMGPSCPLG